MMEEDPQRRLPPVLCAFVSAHCGESSGATLDGRQVLGYRVIT